MKKITKILLIGILSIFLNSSVFALISSNHGINQAGKEANQLLDGFVVDRNKNCTIDENLTIKIPEEKIWMDIIDPRRIGYPEFSDENENLIIQKIRELNPKIPEKANFNFRINNINDIEGPNINLRNTKGYELKIYCGDKNLAIINLEDFIFFFRYDNFPAVNFENKKLSQEIIDEIKFHIKQNNPKLEEIIVNPDGSAVVKYGPFTKNIDKKELLLEIKLPAEKILVKDKNNLTDDEREIFFKKMQDANNGFGIDEIPGGPTGVHIDKESGMGGGFALRNGGYKNAFFNNHYLTFITFFNNDYHNSIEDEDYIENIKDYIENIKDYIENIKENFTKKQVNNIINDDDLIFFLGYGDFKTTLLYSNISINKDEVLIDEKDLEKEKENEKKAEETPKIQGSAPKPEDLVLKNDNRVNVLDYFKDNSEEKTKEKVENEIEEKKSEIEKNLEKVEEDILENKENLELNSATEKTENKKEEIKYLEEFYFDKEIPEKIEEEKTEILEKNSEKEETKMNNLKITRLPKTGPLEIFLILISMISSFMIFKRKIKK